MSSNAVNLARHVRARRDQLQLSQLDIWQAGGPSNTTLTEIENARITNLTRTTARKLDTGLQWEPGSARHAWEGGDPVPLSTGRPTGDGREDLRRRILEAPYLSADEKAEILAALERRQPPPSDHQGEVRGA